jgi:GH24 family phage-related lysozyme (muramidase)
MASNGKLPKKDLARVYHPNLTLYLRKDAAAAFNTMNLVARRLRVPLYATGPISAYRSYEQQVEAKRLYGSNAATPGTSNHGWGLAIDIPQTVQQKMINRIGAKFGWQKKWSDASWEPWHFKWKEGVWFNRPDPGVSYKYPIMRLGSGGPGQKPRVRKIQRRLRAHGFPVKNTKGEFNKLIEKRVKEFQKAKKLKADGIVGETTWKQLLKKPVKSPQKPSKPVDNQNNSNIPKKPKTALRTSLSGIKFIADFEGFYAEPYNDPVGYATVGYGYLLGYRPVKLSDHRAIWIKGQKTPGKLTQTEARKLLAQKLKEDYEPAVNKLFQKGGQFEGKFTQEFYDSLVSFVYNLGAASLSGISGFETIGKAVKKGDKKAVADAMLLYNKAAGQTLPGLVRRRRAERRLALTGNYSTQI